MDTRTKLSTLWIVVILNIIFADILSIIIELVNRNTLNIFGEIITTMAIAAGITNIPILMIYFSKSLSFRINRILNIVASVLTIIYVIGGGSLMPHYIICASIEVIALLIIIITALKWVDTKKILIENEKA
ncbi:DUF6326 family protein [Aequorivita sp. Q41]|uniref:DUF6326 family protein n=1 Tax=Aequorivita sp. Q41 TaxID=3153300 RepID=UPI0032420D7D